MEQQKLEDIRKRDVFGTLWITKDARGREVVNGEIDNQFVYGYINEVEVKRGVNKGKRMKNIKLYKKQNVLKQNAL